MKRAISLFLALVLVVTLAPVAFAAETDPGYTVTSHQSSTLALGVTQDIYTVSMKSDGEQNKFYLATVDLSRDDVEIHANYKDNVFVGPNGWGMQKTSEQMEAAQRRHTDPANTEIYNEYFNVVAGVNAGYYNMSTGQPVDAFVMEGQFIQDCKNRPFFAILADGTPVIGANTADWNKYMADTEHGTIVEAVGGSEILVRDGRNVAPTTTSYQTMFNARAIIGIKADGKTVVMGEVDGLKRPKSRGMTMKELGDVLIEAGCVIGLNLDGGGSSTYVSRQPEDGKLKMLSDPADGYERAVTTTLYVASTTPTQNDFETAEFLPYDDYVTSGATVNLQALAYSSAHTQVAMPEDVKWTLEDDGEELGTLTPGKFVSTKGKTGDAVIKIMQNGVEKGSATIHVVDPDTLTFEKKSYAMPYGKPLTFKVTASYEGWTVKTLEDDIQLSLSDLAMGVLNGMTLTSCAEGESEGGQVSATFRENGVTTSVSVTFGKESTVIWNFDKPEDAEIFSVYDMFVENPKEGESRGKYNEKMYIEYATAENGHVHSGEGALRVTFDGMHLLDDPCSSGQYAVALRNEEAIDTREAKCIGAWIWIPDEELTSGVGITWGKDSDAFKQDAPRLWDEGHWQYIYHVLTDEEKRESLTHNSLIDFFLYTSKDPNIYKRLSNKLVFYIDDFTIDYSDVVPDRDLPTIQNPVLSTETGGYLELVRGNVEVSELGPTMNFKARVSDVEADNATGLNEKSVEAFIDGNKIDAAYSDGQIVTQDVTLTSGVHTLKLTIEDVQGNKNHVIRQFNVTGDSVAPTVTVTPHDPDTGKLLISSVYSVDVTADDISVIDKVELELDLINNAKWEIEHGTVVNPKFDMTFSIDPYENIATVTFTRKSEGGEWVYGDSNLIATIPARVWGSEWPTEKMTPTVAWSTGYIPPIELSIDVDRGTITYAEGFESGGVLPAFGAERIRVDTELDKMQNDLKSEDPGKTSWHVHSASTPVEDLAPTCTTAGYSNRKVCEVCGCPVNAEDWGTFLPATGHNYAVGEDGILKCTNSGCEQTYTGVWTDGCTYEDGVLVGGEDGQWVDESYYVSGKKVTGLQKINDVYYLFDENGVCAGKEPYTGFADVTKMTVESVTPASVVNFLRDYTYTLPVENPEDTYYYLVGGVPKTGWFSLDGGFRFHADADGKLHLSVHAVDGRTCSTTGRWTYTCEGEGCPVDHSEYLFFEGHDWGENYECRKCGFSGINIERLGTLRFGGEFYKYTGGSLVPDFTLTVFGKTLNVGFDAYAYEGGGILTNNVKVGTATLTIEGRGDYYGTIVGHFKIVPQSLDETGGVTAVQENHSDVKLSWGKAAGAEYYSIYRETEPNKWEFVANTAETTYTVTGLELGESYRFRVGSRAHGLDENGVQQVYYCARWAYADGTVDHLWGEQEAGSYPATCTEDGLVVHSCTVEGCEAQNVETVLPKLGHDVKEWTVVQDATTSAPGSRTGECIVCGEMVTEEIPQLPYVSPGASGGTDPSNKTETVTNPDGSTTTTTTSPDGSTTETTTKPDGTVTEKNTDADGVVTEKTVTPDNTVTEKVTQTDGSATERTTTPDGVTGQVNTDAEGEVTSAEVVIPKEAEKQDVVTAPVEVPASKSAETAPEINVKVGFGESAKVEIPVTEFGPGTVAVVVNPDGTEEIVRDCVIGENGVVLNVEGDVTLKIVDNTETFEDVEPAHHWATDAVEFVTARELFKGTGANKFTPNGAMTRGMMVTVLYRLAYEPDTVAEQFEDVPSGQYYTDAVAWAQNAGVVTGYTDSEFGPNDNVKREQLVTILYRYAKKMGYATTSSGTLAGYADASSVSGWAKDAMSWAVELGLVNGVDKTHLAPANNATRAEVATILMRFCEKVVK